MQQKSYDLKIVSVSGSVGSFEIPATQHSEDVNSQPSVVTPQKLKPRRPSTHVRNLSPVDIVVSSSEEVNEQFSQPSSSDDVLMPQPTHGARRSLAFGKTNGKENLTSFSSTPMVGRKSTNTRFFNKSIVAPSPIKLSQASDEGALLAVIASESKKTPRKSQSVSMADIEQSLRSQYNIPSKSEHNAPARRMSAAVTTPKSTKSAQDVRELSVMIEPLNMDVISNYRKQQMSRLSLRQNVTDIEPVSMQETGISSRPPSVASNQSQFAELRRKLDLCDVTDDDEDDSDDDVEPLKMRPNKSTAAEQPAERNTSEQFEVEEAEEEIEDPVEKSLRALHADLADQNRPADNVGAEMNPPTTPRRRTVAAIEEEVESPEPSSVSRNSSVNKQVPHNFMESFQNLRRTASNLTKTSELLVSMVTNETIKRPDDRTSLITKSYLEITRKKQQVKKHKKKGKKHEKRKRTLYNNEDEDEETTGDSNSSGDGTQTQSNERVHVHSVEVIVPPAEDETPAEVQSSSRRSKRKRNESSERPVENEFEFKRPIEVAKKAKPKEKLPSNSKSKRKMQKESEPEQEPMEHSADADIEIETQPEIQTTRPTRASKRTKVEAAKKPEKTSEPKSKKFRRIHPVQNDSSSSDDEEEERVDEGFGSGNERDREDVIYEPDNDRYGLRVRKAYRPYWLFNDEDRRNLGVESVDINYNDSPKSCLNEEKFITKKLHEKAAENKKETFKKPNKPAPKAKKSKKPTKSKHIEVENSDPVAGPSSSAAIPTASSAISSTTNDAYSAYSTSSTVECPSNILKFGGAISRLMKDNSNSTLASSVASSTCTQISENGRRELIYRFVRIELIKLIFFLPFLDLSSIDTIQLDETDNGVCFGLFVDSKKDGILKIMPNGFKPRCRSKKSSTVSYKNMKIYRISILII